MDRYMPPSLLVPVVAGTIAAIFGVLGYKFPEGSTARLLSIGIAVILFLVAFVTGGNWLWYTINKRIEEVRSAWYSPTIKLATLVSTMNHEQIIVYEQVSPFRGSGRLTPGGMLWTIWTPLGDLPVGWVANYLEQCQVSFPLMLPQHGLPDNRERDNRRKFHALLTQNGFAEPARGADTVKLSVPLATVLSKLDLVEG